MNYLYVHISSAEYREQTIEIIGHKYHHLVRVRRVRVGTPLRAALPDGRVLIAEISEITPEVLRAQVTGEMAALGQSPCHITLFQAVLKGEKMEMVVQKASELGVATLVPLLARRSIPQWKPEQAVERAERWQRIADAAAEQCERCVPLQVEIPRSLQEALPVDNEPAFLLHERQGQSLRAIAAQNPTLSALGMYIGAEGGWDDAEAQLLLQAGVVPIHLGGRILRAETASVVAVTLAQYLWGDLGSASLER